MLSPHPPALTANGNIVRMSWLKFTKCLALDFELVLQLNQSLFLALSCLACFAAAGLNIPTRLRSGGGAPSDRSNNSASACFAKNLNKD